jgi:hypothetical protein
MFDNRPRIWFSLFVLAVFCVGLASGVLLGRRMVGPPGRPFGNFEGPSGPGLRRGGPPPGILLDRLDRELSFTDEQRARVGSVLKTSRERLDQFQQDTHNRLENEQRDLREQIRRQLTPEQQARFDRWIEANPPRGPGRRGRGERPPGLLP